jgi:hypothetical protein
MAVFVNGLGFYTLQRTLPSPFSTTEYFGHSGKILLCRFAYLYVFVCFCHLG